MFEIMLADDNDNYVFTGSSSSSALNTLRSTRLLCPFPADAFALSFSSRRCSSVFLELDELNAHFVTKWTHFRSLIHCGENVVFAL